MNKLGQRRMTYKQMIRAREEYECHRLHEEMRELGYFTPGKKKHSLQKSKENKQYEQVI